MSELSNPFSVKAIRHTRIKLQTEFSPPLGHREDAIRIELSPSELSDSTIKFALLGTINYSRVVLSFSD